MTTIIVVDDMAIFREPIAEALRAKGFEVICAENGRQAIRLVRSYAPDLILLDVSMPIMDGIEYLRTVAGDPTIPRPPVIVLTEVAERNRVLQAARLGVGGYMLKSQFSLDELLTRIGRCLEGGDSAVPAEGCGNVHRPHAAVRGHPAQSGVSVPDDAPAGETPAPAPGAFTASDAAGVLKSAKPLMTKAEVIKRLKSCGELKALSPAVANVLKLTQSDRTSIESIAQAIKQDQAMAVRILKLANSVVYTRGQPVQTIDKAVVRIGLSQIRQVMLNISVIDQFSLVTVGDADIGQFWEHALACGIIAAEIARASCPERADLAFTLGLVHDVGRIFYAEQFGDDYGRVVRTASDLRLPLEQVETRLMGLNHADGMDHLLHSWKFPKELIDPIVLHHHSVGHIRRLAPRAITEAATLTLANRLCHALALGSSGNDTIYPTEEFCELLKLDAGVLQRIEETARRETVDLKLAMLAETEGTGWVDCRERYREGVPGPVRPLFVSAQPQFDAFRMFLDQLADRSDERPNVGIVHLRDVRDRVRISEEYAAAEVQSGARDLPVIVLSPKGDLGLVDDVMADRHHELLPTPVVIARFIEAINRALNVSHRRAAA